MPQATPVFDAQKRDRVTFAPFVLTDGRQTKWQNLCLFFCDWAWFERVHGSDKIDGYYLNGYGIQGLVEAVMFDAGIRPPQGDVELSSEADTCFVYFKDLDTAVTVASAASAMIQDRAALRRMIQVARAQGFED